MRFIFPMLFLIGLALTSQAQVGNSFSPVDEYWPTPNSYRSANGAPGPAYWQQKADYTIKVTLNEKDKRLSGEETITYFNNSPDTLTYLWLQLDQNVRAKNNINDLTKQASLKDGITTRELVRSTGAYLYKGGIDIEKIENDAGQPLKYIINRTMMKVLLENPLPPGGNMSLNLSWSYTIYDRLMVDGRGGSEYFPEDDNRVFTIAQFYPRMCVYDDVEGWQNKQFIISGEFALTFGDFNLEITVPEDHVVAATGELVNAEEVLTSKQLDRLKRVKEGTNKPVEIITEAEAEANEKSKRNTLKTWKFKANNVRDVAFASSRKFIWDAQSVQLGDNDVLAMSFYTKEGNPLWKDESTKAIVNTLETYTDLLFPYPYPVAQSVTSADQGMEYPMISFNEGRPSKKGRYNDDDRNELLDVVIHEIGHNYFPMIINSDEKLYAWMDEGINTYYELQTKRTKYSKDQHWGDAKSMTFYMAVDAFMERPIMTNPENLIFSEVSSYGKPSAALEVLNKLVLGPELFNDAMKEYARRWKFKHPKPADFFRTIEDVAGSDLDWFWRGWFYGVEPVDISIDNVSWYRLDPITSAESKNKFKIPETPQKWNLTTGTDREYREFNNRVDDGKVVEALADKNIYEITFTNKGGLISPIVIEFTFDNNKKETVILPVEIWKNNEKEIKKVFLFDRIIKKVQLDPQKLTGDVTLTNNVYPR